MPQFHFISGLPRSGSTLLSALLSQNPRFAASITSPVSSLCTALIPKMSSGTEFSMFFDERKRVEILRGVFDNYYSDAPADGIVFDTNRRWTGRMALLDQLYPGARVICCVRDIGWILDSLERAIRRDPTQASKLSSDTKAKTVYSRAEAFMGQEDGLVGQAWCLLREAWFGAFARKLVVVPYERLVDQPALMMERLYAALGEKPFDHDFDHIEFSADEFDERAATPGLHTVKPRVANEARELSIPPDIVAKYADTSFWLNPKLNHKGVLVL